jgi:hypothetical protein
VSELVPTPWAGLYIKASHVPRAQFSASQLETASCRYAWALRYLIGLRQPELSIETHEEEAQALARLPNATKRERSLLFGTLLHRRLERYFSGESVNWTDDIGQRALTGLGFLPQPSLWPLRVEEPISIAPSSVLGGIDIAFVGYVDLECDHPSNDVLIDYKSTGNLRWIKRADELRENVAACAYALSSMQRKGTQQQKCRWVYFLSTGRPAARAVEFTITRDQAMTVVRSAFIQAAGLKVEVETFYAASLDQPEAQPINRLPLIDHLPKNTSICKSYGGCPMHYSAGGPCQPGPKTFDLDSLALDLGSVKETDHATTSNQPKEQDMATLAERLAALNGNPPVLPQQPAQAAPVFAAAPAVNPFAPAAQAPVAPPVSPAVFGAPIVAADGLTAPAPAVAPFNPNANPFGAAAPAAAAPAAPAVNPFAALAPGLPAFATSSLPPVGALPVFQGFGAAPAQQPTADAVIQSAQGESEKVFAGVNSPEASTAISAAEAAAQPTGKRKRRTKAEMQADAASGVSRSDGATVSPGPDGGPGISDFEITITIRDLHSDAALTLPAPDQIAQQMIDAVGSVLAGLR